jgi:hypothetical protein
MLSVLTAGIAHIHMGHAEAPFDAHIKLLCGCSRYFDRLLKDRAAQTLAKLPIYLSAVGADVFAEVNYWMHQGKLSKARLPGAGQLFLSQLWLLASKFEMPGLQNTVILLYGRRIIGRLGCYYYY